MTEKRKIPLDIKELFKQYSEAHRPALLTIAHDVQVLGEIVKFNPETGEITYRVRDGFLGLREVWAVERFMRLEQKAKFDFDLYSHFYGWQVDEVISKNLPPDEIVNRMIKYRQRRPQLHSNGYYDVISQIQKKIPQEKNPDSWTFAFVLHDDDILVPQLKNISLQDYIQTAFPSTLETYLVNEAVIGKDRKVKTGGRPKTIRDYSIGSDPMSYTLFVRPIPQLFEPQGDLFIG